MRRAVLVLLVLCTAGRARAADITDVASSFDENNRFDFRFRVFYDHQEKRAQIKREFEELTPSQNQIQTLKDLTYSRAIDTVALRAEFGIFHDLSVSFELPIVISDQQIYEFDQSASPCVFPGMSPTQPPNCVNASNSSTLQDGIVPMSGFDATAMGRATMPPTVFRGVLRGAKGGSGLDGFDTFNVAINWAPMSQARDDTKPTWVIGVEGDFSIGNIKKFDRNMPDANHAVSEGVHRFIARTQVSRRFKYLDPYVEFWYMLPIARGDSLFINYGPTQKVKNPAQQGGTRFGLEIVPFDRPAQQYKFAISLDGRVEGHFQGRGYSEIWELLAASPALACDTTVAASAQYNPACTTAVTNPYQNKPYTGVTTIQNYATVGVGASLLGQIGPYARLRVGFDYTHDQSHLITGEDIGTPQNGSGRVQSPQEFNPAYRAIIDQPGRRYKVDNVNVYDVWVYGQVMF